MYAVKISLIFYVLYDISLPSDSSRIRQPTQQGVLEQVISMAAESSNHHIDTPRERDPLGPQNSANTAGQFRHSHAPSTTITVPDEGEDPGVPGPIQEGTASPCGRHKACGTYDDSEFRRLELMTKTILSSLKMSKPPNVTRRQSLDSPVIQMLKRRYKLDQKKLDRKLQEDLEVPIKHQKVITWSKPPPFDTGNIPAENWFYFNFSEEQRRDFIVKSANLWYNIRPNHVTSGYAEVALGQYWPLHNYNTSEKNYSPTTIMMDIFNLTQHTRRGYWRKIDVKGMVRGWFENPGENFGIHLAATEYSNPHVPDLVVTGSRPGEDDLKPLLDVELVHSKRRRKKRSAIGHCTEGDGENRCCMYDMEIDFEAIGWGEWIIFPTKFNGKKCKGHCSMGQMNNFRQTLDSTRLNSLQRRLPNQRPTTCCVPKRYAPLDMLYYDESENIVFSRVPDMEIMSCDCV